MPHISEALLQAYIDGFCNEARRAEVEAHVDDCAQCRERLEQARGAAERASRLLGALEPGPVHAPSFEELKERAMSQPAGADKVAAAIALARAATEKPASERRPTWRRPALAWAATVVIAFGVGWMMRGRLMLVDPGAPASMAQDRFAGRLPATTPAPAGGPVGEPAAVEPGQSVAGREQDDAPADNKAAAESTASADAVPPVELVEAWETGARPDRQVAEAGSGDQTGQASGAAASRQQEEVALQRAVAPPRAAEERAAPAPQQETVAVTGMSPLVDVNERAGESVPGSPVAGGFVAVPRDDAALWLGAPPRELPELALLRAEVGPGALLDTGIPSRPAVRLVYLARTGQEIAVLQQYTGPIGATELDALDGLAALRAGADAPAAAERARSERFRAASALADRDAAVAAADLDLPATTRDPDGRVTYTWLDAEGYLMSISAVLDADVVRGLADRIR